jgi:hypothetical protein
MGGEQSSTPSKNASYLRARHASRSLRRENYVESLDSTPFSLLDLDPRAVRSATEPSFDGLPGSEGLHCAPRQSGYKAPS